MRYTIRDRIVEVSGKIGTETGERVSEREQAELEGGSAEKGLAETEGRKGLTKIRGRTTSARSVEKRDILRETARGAHPRVRDGHYD